METNQFIRQQQTNIQQEFDQNKIPPDWDFAKSHGKSCKPGKHTEQHTEICPCCLNTINKSPVSLWQDNKQLTFLGQGFPLFYNFLKFCMIMLILIIIDSCAVQLLLNLSEFKCVPEDTTHDIYHNYNTQPTHENHRRLQQTFEIICTSSAFNQFAWVSKNSIEPVRILLAVLSFIGQLFVLIYFRQQQSVLAEYLNERNTSPKDYTLTLLNIPTGSSDYKKKITYFINEIIPSGNVMQILIIQNLQQFYEKQRKKTKLIEQKKKIIKQGGNDQQLTQVMISLHQKQKQIEDLEDFMQNHEEQYFLGEAYIIMKIQEQKDKTINAINQAPASIIKKYFQNYQENTKEILMATNTPQPRQINWENIHYTKKQRFIAIILMWFIYAFILAVITGIFFLILFKKQEDIMNTQHQRSHISIQEYQSKMFSGKVLGYFVVILINFLNKFGLSWIAHYLTHYQKHYNYTDLQYSFAMKYMLGMFFTTALMTLIVQAAIFNNYTQVLGVIDQETFMFIFNALFPPIVWLINPYNIIGAIKRKFYYGNNYMTQKQANQIMELYPYDMGKRYAQIMKTMWFTFLYIQLIPIGAVFSLIGLILYYIVDKFVLLRRSTVKQGISAYLSTSMIKILQFTLVLKSLGQVVFDYQMKSKIDIPSIILLILSIIFMLLPWSNILKWWFPEQFDPQDKPYDEVKQTFIDNYTTCYPLRKRKSKAKLLASKKLIFKSQNSVNSFSQLKRGEVSIKEIADEEKPKNSNKN